MAKLRKPRDSDNQSEPQVKLENQEPDQNKQSSTYSDFDDIESMDEKELDEKKIIKEFLLKRKLLMKALKLKQRQKSPTPFTLEAFQNNEGSSKNQSNFLESQSESSNQQSSSNQSSSQSSSINQQVTKIQQGETFGSKTDIAIQTKIFRKKSIKKSHSSKHTSDKYIFDCLAQGVMSYEKNKKADSLQLLSIKKKKNKKDIEKIRNQIFSHFNQNNGQQSSQNKNKSNSIKQTLSGFRPHGIGYNDIDKIFKEMNSQIQHYYDTKILKNIILQKFIKMINQKSNQENKKMMKKSSDNHKKYKSTKKHESTCMQQEGDQNQTVRKRNFLIKKTKKKHPKNKIPRRIINDRFKMVLMKNDQIKKNHQKPIQKIQKKQLFSTKEKEFFQKIEDQSDAQTNFDSINAWKSEFQSVQLLLFEKYDFLKEYISGEKKIDFKEIHKNIKSGKHQVSVNNSALDRTIPHSTKSQSDSSSQLEIRNKKINRDENVMSASKMKKNKLKKVIKRKTLKELELNKKDEDQFGKSFDCQQKSQKMPNEENFTFEELNKSNILSNVFNSSFYSQSAYKKTDTSSDEKNKSNLNFSFLSQSRSPTKDDKQIKSDNGSEGNKSSKENQMSFLKGSFYMSQEINFN